MTKPRVLVACPPIAFAIIERVLGPYAELMFVNRLPTARAQLAAHADIAMVVCGVHFDESRMFDLLRYAHQERPDAPFVGVRLLEQEATRMQAEGIATSCKVLGAVDYVDVVAMVREHGRDVAERRFGELLREHLRPGAGSSA
jgi:hypothetical protein